MFFWVEGYMTAHAYKCVLGKQLPVSCAAAETGAGFGLVHTPSWQSHGGPGVAFYPAIRKWCSPPYGGTVCLLSRCIAHVYV